MPGHIPIACETPYTLNDARIRRTQKVTHPKSDRLFDFSRFLQNHQSLISRCSLPLAPPPALALALALAQCLRMQSLRSRSSELWLRLHLSSALFGRGGILLVAKGRIYRRLVFARARILTVIIQCNWRNPQTPFDDSIPVPAMPQSRRVNSVNSNPLAPSPIKHPIRKTLDWFSAHRATAVLRTPTSAACPKAMEAAINGGFKICEVREVPLRRVHAPSAQRYMYMKFDLHVVDSAHTYLTSPFRNLINPKSLPSHAVHPHHPRRPRPPPGLCEQGRVQGRDQIRYGHRHDRCRRRGLRRRRR